ncbi:YeiH family protein [Frigoriflavimonas asaccharolytica]|uniref:Putative integral membrane protein (TIGR00698 family) n=1 Tax=Frigoriflavimonas asaccharolytica TaxID=2735899 RepID=A0A8J8K918_9FLAO|nr:putative sulfate exporter family transporter [Frigoriflavimonas asaccharolytica]NRS93438.1 putative integral membrane protein (TIGR00698 family) [Frigoriflavimonas asaccharolytica]
MTISKKTATILFFSLATLSLFPFISPPVALVMGILFINIFKTTIEKTGDYTKKILQYSIVGLGFGINLKTAVEAGASGFVFTVSSIAFVFLVGIILGKILKIDQKVSELITAGTAICGGSAIAAISPIIKANNSQNSVALGIVFLLNSIALLAFPSIGTLFNLTQNQFGIWAAIAIHDTSSVVGAASKYGDIALHVATTVKLARALWIIPIAILFSFINKSDTKVKFPLFIGYFILAILLNTYLPILDNVSPYIFEISKTSLKLALFLIGTGLSLEIFKSMGWKPIFLGVLLWVSVSVLSLWAVIEFIK